MDINMTGKHNMWYIIYKDFLTVQTFCTKTWENLNCKSSNVVYGIECIFCGLIYVGETKGSLHKRISGHRLQINNVNQHLLHCNLNSPNHSFLSMKVRILVEIYHYTYSPLLNTSFRRKRGELSIRKLGTAFPFECNDNVDTKVLFKVHSLTIKCDESF